MILHEQNVQAGSFGITRHIRPQERRLLSLGDPLVPLLTSVRTKEPEPKHPMHTNAKLWLFGPVLLADRSEPVLLISLEGNLVRNGQALHNLAGTNVEHGYLTDQVSALNVPKFVHAVA